MEQELRNGTVPNKAHTNVCALPNGEINPLCINPLLDLRMSAGFDADFAK